MEGNSGKSCMPRRLPQIENLGDSSEVLPPSTASTRRLSEESIDAVKRVDLRSLMEELGVEFPSGIRGNAQCPFHDDHNPSMSVFTGSSGHDLCHCFACGLTHDSIGFVEQHEGLPFLAAVALIADRFDIPIETEAPETIAERRRLNSRFGEHVQMLQEETAELKEAISDLRLRLGTDVRMERNCVALVREKVLRRGQEDADYWGYLLASRQKYTPHEASMLPKIARGARRVRRDARSVLEDPSVLPITSGRPLDEVERAWEETDAHGGLTYGDPGTLPEALLLLIARLAGRVLQYYHQNPSVYEAVTQIYANADEASHANDHAALELLYAGLPDRLMDMARTLELRSGTEEQGCLAPPETVP